MKLFDPTETQLESLQRKLDELPAIQARLVERHPRLSCADRIAHQQQLAGGPIEMTIAHDLPAAMESVGLFRPGAVHRGVGRISNGLGCPHLETDPDFLGIMLAFKAGGHRVDFLGINDPAAPTDTVDEFVSVLAATAESAGVEIPFGDAGELDLGNLTAAQLKMFDVLRERLGLVRATQLYAHIAKQTARTLVSSTALQTYWTGVVRLSDTLGKFTLVPTADVNRRRRIRPGGRHLTEDWRERVSESSLGFRLLWIPYLDERRTPTNGLTRAWDEQHRIEVATVSFQRIDAATRRAQLFALLASEMGANPGNWVRARNPGPADAMPATEFTAGRFLAYKLSQAGRDALPDPLYDAVFESGEIPAALETELVRRYRAKLAAGHAQPDLGDLR